MIDNEMQKRYCSGVGMPLYLTKYLRPDVCNVVRELSKCMDEVTMGTHLEMFRVAMFVLDSKKFCLKLCPKFNHTDWNLKVFCDSDWAGDPETRSSVTGFIVYRQMHPFAGALRHKRELLSQAVRQRMLQSLRL
jgi:hypothetical protein